MRGVRFVPDLPFRNAAAEVLYGISNGVSERFPHFPGGRERLLEFAGVRFPVVVAGDEKRFDSVFRDSIDHPFQPFRNFIFPRLFFDAFPGKIVADTRESGEFQQFKRVREVSSYSLAGEGEVNAGSHFFRPVVIRFGYDSVIHRFPFQFLAAFRCNDSELIKADLFQGNRDLRFRFRRYRYASGQNLFYGIFARDNMKFYALQPAGNGDFNFLAAGSG